LNSGIQTFSTQKEKRNFGRAASITSRIETKKIETKLPTKCSKNEQQSYAKNNAELLTKWTKTRKSFEDTVRRGQNTFIKA
jgi:hypothetical protein